ncbi:MAG: hypothetical protein VB088_08070 [Sphaerochaeta sp.]|jgi:hypothetical protein|nr:hypothetical protein [Sphaerochaeta sp.]
MMTRKDLNDRQVQFGNNLEIMLTAIARSLKINGVPVDVINKAFFAGNAAVQMLGQKKNPSEEGMVG